MFYSCKYQGDSALRIIPVMAIKSVVAMIPHKINEEEWYFMFEQPGMDVARMGGYLVANEDDEDTVVAN